MPVNRSFRTLVRISELAESFSQADALELFRLLVHPSSSVRDFALLALATKGNPYARIAARTGLCDRSNLVRNSAAETLADHGDEQDYPYVVPLLRDKSWVVRCSAAQAVATTGGQAARRPLVDRWSVERNATVRRHVAEALGRLAAVRDLEDFLDVERSTIGRVGILIGLVESGRVSYAEELRGLLSSTEPFVADVAGQALKEFTEDGLI